MKRSLNILALLLALAMMLSACAGRTPDTGDSQTPVNSDTQTATDDNNAAPEQNANNETDGPAQSEGNGQDHENDSQQEDTQDPGAAPEQDSAQNEVLSPEDRSSYEEYLSALSLFALSMEYPDFQLQGIYAASAVSMDNKTASQGIYVFFDSMGESLCIRVTPIGAERTEAGTLDLFANELGYAAFELQSELPDTNSLTLLDSKVYGPLLSELNGIALYSH